MRFNNRAELFIAIFPQPSHVITLFGGYGGNTAKKKKICPDSDLLPSFATPPSATFELHHHDSDVVRAATVERLEDDAFGAKVRLVKALANEPNGLLVAERIP